MGFVGFVGLVGCTPIFTKRYIVKTYQKVGNNIQVINTTIYKATDIPVGGIALGKNQIIGIAVASTDHIGNKSGLLDLLSFQIGVYQERAVQLW